MGNDHVGIARLSPESAELLLLILDEVRLSATLPDLEERARLIAQARRELLAVAGKAADAVGDQ